MEQTYKVIGRAEVVKFPLLDDYKVHARIDSGARTSAVYGSAVVRDGLLHVTFFNGARTKVFTEYGRQAVASSNGHIEKRFTIKMPVVLKGKRIIATFTIANRSTQVYPVLIGRNVLRGKFIVDVKKGTTLTVKEKARLQQFDEILEKEQQ
jgi:hypothetical protein